MEQLRTRDLHRVVTLAVVAALTAALSACLPLRRGQPAPRFRSPEAVSRREFLDYVITLQFVGAAWDHQMGDQQPMLYPVGDARNAAVGPATTVARVEPEARGNRVKRHEVGQGRVVGRVLSTGRYEPLGLQAGVSYLWVDSTTARGWRGLVIPENPAAPITTLRVLLEPGTHTVVAATFLYDPTVGMVPWITADDLCVDFFGAFGPALAPLRGRLLRTENVGGRPDPLPTRRSHP